MKNTSSKKVMRLVGAVLLLTAVIVLAINGKQWWPQLQGLLDQGGIRGLALFMGLFIGLTVLCFPVSVLGFSAGALFGPWVGLALLYPSGLISGALMYVIGRWLLRDFVQKLVLKNPRLRAIDTAAGQQATRLNILTRLSPFNYGMASYALASGQSRFGSYFLGLLVILPSMTAQVWLGALAGKGGSMIRNDDGESLLRLALLGVGVLFFLILTVQVGRLVRKALDESGG